MKIIGKTDKGYMMEVSPEEVSCLTGKSDDYGYHNSKFDVGTEFTISKTWNHLQHLDSNEAERKRIAESLRAAATLIEHTPSPIIIPETPATEPTK